MIYALRYWWRVFKTACCDSARHLGWRDWKRCSIWLITAIATFTTFYYASGRNTQATENRVMWVLCGLAVVGALFLVVFFGTMIFVPPRLYKEQETEIANLRGDEESDAWSGPGTGTWP